MRRLGHETCGLLDLISGIRLLAVRALVGPHPLDALEAEDRGDVGRDPRRGTVGMFMQDVRTAC